MALGVGRLSVGFVLVGVIQVIGGLLGLYSIGRSLLGASDTQPAVDIVYAIFAVLYLVSVLAGIQLLRMKGSGVSLSFLIQFLQLVQFQTQALVYQFVSGFYLAVGLTTEARGVSFGFDFNVFTSSASLFFPSAGGDPVQFALYVNLLALIIFIWLFRARHTLRAGSP